MLLTVDYPEILLKSRVLLSELLKSNIRFVHWKGTSHLIDSLKGNTDIELLIHPNDKVCFESLITLLDFKKVKSPPSNTFPNIEDWIGFDEERGNLIHLHTHFTLVLSLKFGRYISIPSWTEKLFKLSKIDDKTCWPIPIPEFETIILLVRIGASIKYDDSGRIEEAILPKRIELIELLKKVELTNFDTLRKELQIHLPDNFQYAISDIIHQGTFNEVKNLGKFFLDQIPFDSANSKLGFFLPIYTKYKLNIQKRLYPFLGSLILKKTVIGGGKVIALIGSDGSGKSTLSKDIIKWLTFKIDTHYLYLGENPFMKSYSKNVYTKASIICNKSIIQFILRKLFRKIYYIILVYNKILMLELAKKLSKKGSVIICDRFPQKDILGFNDGPKLSQYKGSWFSIVEMKLFNQLSNYEADIVFRLNVDPDVAILRKPEHDSESIILKCGSIKNIQFNHAVVIDIDANMPYEDVLLTIKKKNLEMFMNPALGTSNQIVEIIGPPGVGKTTIYENVCKEWQPKHKWIYHEALLAPSFLKPFAFNNWVKNQIVVRLGKRKIRKLPIELGLRFVDNHIDLANFYWEHISKSNVYTYEEIARKFRSAYFLYADFCKYQSIYDKSVDKICLVNEGLFQKSLLVNSDHNYTKTILSKYLTLVPIPHALILIDLADSNLIVSRLRTRNKVIASHVGKDDKALLYDIEEWQFALNLLVEEAQRNSINVIKVDGSKPVKENVTYIKGLLNSL